VLEDLPLLKEKNKKEDKNKPTRVVQKQTVELEKRTCCLDSGNIKEIKNNF
jgi:hypothetical protein